MSRGIWIGLLLGGLCLIILLIILFTCRSKTKRINQDIPNIVWVFWFGKPMSERRRQSLKEMERNLKVPITLVTEENLKDYLKWPVHPSVPHLSKIHQSDYYRIYFCLHYGGGYADIKPIQEDWRPHFQTLRKNPDIWVIGVPEIFQTVRNLTGEGEARNHSKYIRQSWFIVKPNNAYFEAIHEEQNRLLDLKGELLLKHPPTHDRCCQRGENGYPFFWEELLGQVMCRKAPTFFKHIAPLMKVPSYEGYL